MSKLNKGRPLPGVTRARRRIDPLKVPEIAPHERDAVSFWFRRILTTLAVANGAGILALSSFISSSKDLRVAAIVAYPTLSYFLTGGFITFACFAISFMWAGARGDAYGEYFIKVGEAIKTRAKPERSIYYAYIGIFTFVFFGQIAAMLASGAFFYAGAAEVVNGLGAVACSADKTLPYCKAGASFIFRRDALSEYNDSEAALKHATALAIPSAPVPQATGNAVVNVGGDFILNQTVSANSAKPSARMKVPEVIDLATTSDQDPVLSGASVIARVLVIRATADDIECRLNISNFYVGDSSPLVLNPEVETFLNLDRKIMNGGTVRISIQKTTVTAEFKDQDNKVEYGAFVIEHGVVSRRDFMVELSQRENFTDANVLSVAPNGLLVFAFRKKLSQGCADAAKVLGWRIV